MSIKRPEDPREAYPALKLTGNVISATFAIPRSITFDGNDWVWENMTFIVRDLRLW